MKDNRKQIVTIIIIFLILITILIAYMTYMLNRIEANTNNSIKTIVKNDANNLKTQITEQKAILQSITNEILSDNIVDTKKIFDMYEKSDVTSHFIRMAIMYEDGRTITNDGHEVDYSDEIDNFFSNNEIHISENRISKIDEEEITIYSQAISIENEKIAILLIVKTESYKDTFSNKVFEGKGFSYIVNKDGTIIVSANTDKETGNLIENIEQMLVGSSRERFEANKNTIQDNIKNEVSGSRTLQTTDGQYYMVYEPIGVNDWSIATFIPSKAIAGEANRALLTTFILAIIVIFIILSICIYIVISNNKKQKQLFEYAYIDPITKKGNIYYFRKKGQEMLDKEKSKENQYLLVLDINKFKMINKAYGYKTGDTILNGIGEELEKTLGKQSLICRYSNDYFAVLFEYTEDIRKIVNTLVKNIENLKIDSNVYNLSVNMGIYKLTDADTNISVAMDKAIIAHSASKGDVFDKFHIYDEKMEKELEKESKIEQEMYQALMNNEFKVYYQPKVYVQDEKLYGAEALVRWEHNGKMVPPSEFVPLFEKNKFILKLDVYVFEQVCSDMKKWKEKYGKEPVISVNVSREHFLDEHFLEKYMLIATKNGINTNKIDLEITESATVEAGIDIIEIMNKMKKLGFLISIDDFGTGYSSLSTLQDMPADILKIDKSFVDRIGKNEKNMIDYILTIAKELKLTTIAEGVETKEQRDYLLEKGGDIIQGYYYAKPMPEEEFEEYMEKE
mgnify:FL=1